MMVACLGLTLAYLSAAGALWNLGMPQKAIGIPAAVPDDPEIAMAQAAAAFRSSLAIPTARELAQLRTAARLDPLEDEPFLFAALRQSATGNGRKAVRLLEEARRRDPRSTDTRVVLLGHYLKARQAAPAVREIRALSRLLPPQGRAALVALLAGLIRSPDTRAAALGAIPSHPLRIALLEKLARDGADSGLLLEIAAGMGGVAAEGNGAWAERTIEALINRGDLEAARRLWASLYGIEPKYGESAVWDSEFAGLGGPPFGWKVGSGPAGLAEISGSVLRVRYFGRDRAQFARQLLMLPSGSYRLGFRALAYNRHHPADLAWRIACVESREPLIELPLDDSGKAGSASFEVPAEDCPAQWLSLWGRPEPFPETSTVGLRKVWVERTGRP
ncbi:MAG: hypothetical protein KDE21_08115 [Novosphingobium sp.]|nr:hypothetical protein [Novosphingobium sp.]